jgi:hypothetical protein
MQRCSGRGAAWLQGIGRGAQLQLWDGMYARQMQRHGVVLRAQMVAMFPHLQLCISK